MIRTIVSGLAALLVALASQSALAAVDVNRANQAELESIKGIGPRLSQRILQARSQAEFKDWNDLIARVSGVGPGAARRYSQDGLTVGGGAFDPAQASPVAKGARSMKSRAGDASMPRASGTRASPSRRDMVPDRDAEPAPRQRTRKSMQG